MRPIFIIGYMGSGKTTLGRALGKTLMCDFIDLDLYIENRFRRTIRQLFEQYGEQEFRRIEHAMLHEVAEMENVIIACGGGTPCYYDNVEYMNKCGLTIFLQTSIDRLFQRLARKRHKRPLIMNFNDEQLRCFIVSNLNERLQYYNKADHSFCGEELEDTKQIQLSVEKFMSQFGSLLNK